MELGALPVVFHADVAGGRNAVAPGNAPGGYNLPAGRLKLYGLLVLGAVLLSGCGKPEDRSGLVGKPAPAFSVSPLRPAGDVKLADLKGKVVILDFWATWCGPCRMLMPHLADLQQKYGAQGLTVLGISTENRDVVSAFRSANPGLKLDLYLDPKVDAVNSYQATNLPTTVVIGKDGTVAYWDQGFAPQVVEEIESKVKDLLAG